MIVGFNRYKTFAWANTEDVSLKDTSFLMHSRIKNEIEFKLTQGEMIPDGGGTSVMALGR